MKIPRALKWAAPAVVAVILLLVATAVLAPHRAGAAHPLQPKNLAVVAEIDMHEFYFANVQGEKNPTFRLPAGKIVGIHIHNEGTQMHEIVIGRNVKKDGDYEQTLTELVESDLFFYYGNARAEIGGAMYGEVEVDQGMRDIWIRLNVPANLKGEWELGCFVVGHYDSGMHAKLIFE